MLISNKLIILVFFMVIFGSGISKAQENDWRITNVHNAITSVDKWLNTSRAITADDLKGRIILLDFWTFCCINCIHVIPDLQYLEHKFGDKIAVIGVHSAKFQNEKDSENIRSAILRYGIEHPVVNDADFKIWQGFGVRAWPTFVLINPDGIIEEVYSGEGNRNQVEDDINSLLKKYKNINAAKLPISLEKDKAPKTILKFPGKIASAENIEGKPAIFISDSGNNRIIAVRDDGEIFLKIGSGKAGFKDGDFSVAEFNDPQGLLYNDGILYVAETKNHALREINLNNKTVKTIAGTGIQGHERRAKNEPALRTPLASPWDLEFYPDKNHIAIAMAGTHQLWSYDIKNKTVSFLAGNGRESIDDGAYPFYSLSQPSGLSALGDKLYFVDSETSSLRVLQNGEIETLIGTGLFDFGYAEGKQGRGLLQHPLGLFADESGVYIADSYNHSIRRYDFADKAIRNYIGDGKRGNASGKLSDSRFSEPNDIIKIGDVFYVADTNNNKLRKVDIKTGVVSDFEIKDNAEANIEPVEDLPNPIIAPEIKVKSGAPLDISIALDTGWKINHEAPTWLAVFDGKKPIAYFNKDKVAANKLKIPALSEDKSYRLQGIFYFCEDKEGSLCLIRGYDKTFKPSAKNPATKIDILVTSEEKSN